MTARPKAPLLLLTVNLMLFSRPEFPGKAVKARSFFLYSANAVAWAGREVLELGYVFIRIDEERHKKQKAQQNDHLFFHQ